MSEQKFLKEFGLLICITEEGDATSATGEHELTVTTNRRIKKTRGTVHLSCKD